jgi:transcriptional regulator with XRE-family HTH domain
MELGKTDRFPLLGGAGSEPDAAPLQTDSQSIPVGLPTGETWPRGLLQGETATIESKGDPANDEVCDEGEANERGPRATANASLRRAVGARFVAAREINGFLQSEAAALLGWANSTQLNLIEMGKRLPPHDVMLRAATVYAVSLDFLYAATEEPDGDRHEAEKRAMLRSIREVFDRATCAVADAIDQQQASQPGLMAFLQLLDRADDAVNAFQRFVQLNSDACAFEDMRGGARLSRSIETLREHAHVCRLERDRQDRIWADGLKRIAAAGALAPQHATAGEA